METEVEVADWLSKRLVLHGMAGDEMPQAILLMHSPASKFESSLILDATKAKKTPYYEHRYYIPLHSNIAGR